jgi:hypothetical protein
MAFSARLLVTVLSLVVMLFSIGCASRPYQAALDPDLTAPELIHELLTNREHYVISSYAGMQTKITESGSGHGGSFVGIGETRSRLVENQLINDRFDKHFIRHNPMLLVPLLKARDPEAVLTAMYVYENVLRVYPHNRDEPEVASRDREHIMRLILQHGSSHGDIRVRIQSYRMAWHKGILDVATFERYMDDPSQEVRLIAATMGIRSRRADPFYDRDDSARAQRSAVDYMRALITNLDDPHPHVADEIWDTIGQTVNKTTGHKSLQAIGAPELEPDLRSSLWVHLGWKQRSKAKAVLLDWWENTGEQAYSNQVRVFAKEEQQQAKQ